MSTWLEDIELDDGSAEQVHGEDGPFESRDLLDRYLEEVGAISMLKRDEELAIARRIAEGKERAARAVFSLPFAVARLLSAAEAVRRGEIPVSAVVRLSDYSKAGIKEQVRLLCRAMRTVERLRQVPQGDARRSDEHAALRRERALISGILKLKIRPDFIASIVEELRAEIRKVRAATELPDSKARRRALRECSAALGCRIEAAEEALRDYAVAQEEAERAKKRLVEANLRLVVKTAKRYVGVGGAALADIIQDGNIGLMRAADLFEYQRGFKFSTYAVYWIKQSITRSISNTARMIRLPVHTLDDLGKVLHASGELAREAGNEPSHAELAMRADMSEERVAELIGLAGEPLSLNLCIGNENQQLMDCIEDSTVRSPLDMTVEADTRRKVRLALTSLDAKEELVVRNRFSIDTEARTLNSIALELGLSRERIRQIEMKALQKLRAFLQRPAVVEPRAALFR